MYARIVALLIAALTMAVLFSASPAQAHHDGGPSLFIECDVSSRNTHYWFHNKATKSAEKTDYFLSSCQRGHADTMDFFVAPHSRVYYRSDVTQTRYWSRCGAPNTGSYEPIGNNATLLTVLYNASSCA